MKLTTALALAAVMTLVIQWLPDGTTRTPVTPTIEEVATATQWISGVIDVAGDKGVYIESRDLTEMRRTFAVDSGGVWCGGAVEFTRRLWESWGWNVGTLNFGTPGGWTHMVVIVMADTDWFVADPYLGYVWDTGLIEGLSGIDKGDPPGRIDFGVTRDVHFSSGATLSESWTVGRNTPAPLVYREGQMLTCRLSHDVTDYIDRYPASEEFLDALQAEDLPRDIASGVVLTFGVHAMGRYWDVDGGDEALDILVLARSTSRLERAAGAVKSALLP